jgi:hypothetical protein
MLAQKFHKMQTHSLIKTTLIMIVIIIKVSLLHHNISNFLSREKLMYFPLLVDNLFNELVLCQAR